MTLATLQIGRLHPSGDLMVGEKAIICGWKLRKSWQGKLDFSHKPQSNPSPALTLVRSQISLCGYELINNSQGWCICSQ